jgi:hypothetical protein
LHLPDWNPLANLGEPPLVGQVTLGNLVRVHALLELFIQPTQQLR